MAYYDVGNQNTRRPSLITGSTGAAVALGAMALCGIEVPVGMASTAVTFEMSATDGVWLPVYDATGALVTVTIGNTARYTSMKSILLLGLSNVRPVFNNAGDAGKTVYLYGQVVAN